MVDAALSGHTTSALRRLTHLTTLRTVRSGGAMTLAQIARASGLSRPTVASQLDELAEQGWVEEQSAASSGGRPARQFRFRAQAGYAVGVDIGAHTVRIGVADLAGDVLATRRAKVAETAGAADRLAVVRETLTATLDEAQVARSQVLAAAVGTVGVVDPAGRVSLSVLPEWSGVDLAGRLGRALPCPLLVDNDANLAALAEHWLGASREADNVVHVLAGRRNGAGLIIDGRLFRGRSGAAGEIGALDLLGWDEAPGELAQAAGAEADPETAIEQVFAAARTGDATARAAVERFAVRLAQGIAAMVLTVDPDLIVVGGGVSLAREALIGPLTEQVGKLCLSTPALRISELGEESVMMGAIKLALTDVDRRLLGLDATLSG
ncbi:ROK family transcriptional regulator [Kribbella sp. NPDC005582]|uniref:ROK family transcriptional regulator n=1 Tax=Kribbella sp. NPDC005582 TaxID=3156893 RepID=UPI0033BFB22C